VAGAGVGTIDARTAGPPGPLIPGSGGRCLRVSDDSPGKVNTTPLLVIRSGYGGRSTLGRLKPCLAGIASFPPSRRPQDINNYSSRLGRPLDISITAVHFPAKRPTGVFLRYEATREGKACGTAVDAKAAPAALPHRR
jgi:hypothetical protein